MRNYILIFFLFLSCKSIFSQEYIIIDTTVFRCTYLYKIQEDSTSKYSTKVQKMLLQVGKNCSKFTSLNQIYRDSVLKTSKNDPTSVNFINKMMPLVQGTPINIYSDYYVYKNYPKKNSLMLTSFINKKNIRVVENSMFQWQLVSGVGDTILGYLCQKAKAHFAGRDYEAWFTMEIPVNDGPYKFNGLPGLIIKINDTQNQHCFEIIKIEKPKQAEPIVFIDKHNYLNISSIEYVKALKVKSAGTLDKVNSGIVHFKDDEAKANAINRLKSRNNFIEKY